MKLIAIILAATLIASNAAPIRESRDWSVDELFDAAWEFQAKLNPKQEDVDHDVTEYRTSVSQVLRESSKDALTEVEENARAILELEKPVKAVVDQLNVGLCSTNLKQLLAGITEFTGFESSNCVKLYDKDVNVEVKKAQDLISLYDGMFTELQQLVVQAFIGRNQFNQQEDIVNAFEVEFDRKVKAWEDIKPDVEAFIGSLSGKIADINNLMETCMKEVQNEVVISYGSISRRVQTCIDFDNSQVKVKSMFVPLTLEEILPKRYFESRVESL